MKSIDDETVLNSRIKKMNKEPLVMDNRFFLLSIIVIGIVCLFGSSFLGFLSIFLLFYYYFRLKTKDKEV
jgi:hypothetical protein